MTWEEDERQVAVDTLPLITPGYLAFRDHVLQGADPDKLHAEIRSLSPARSHFDRDTVAAFQQYRDLHWMSIDHGLPALFFHAGAGLIDAVSEIAVTEGVDEIFDAIDLQVDYAVEAGTLPSELLGLLEQAWRQINGEVPLALTVLPGVLERAHSALPEVVHGFLHDEVHPALMAPVWHAVGPFHEGLPFPEPTPAGAAVKALERAVHLCRSVTVMDAEAASEALFQLSKSRMHGFELLLSDLIVEAGAAYDNALEEGTARTKRPYRETLALVDAVMVTSRELADSWAPPPAFGVTPAKTPRALS